ncbi:MAG: Uncharacterized protein G01um101416_676 [Microgenomates group bacterium Gr01-1014_16]|nr:MAG: Uncharacterized protein G01um101416_676 [Microgenomates group bacterium Gr01-1014_16]
MVEKSLSAARFARDNAPSAMESHSDTTRADQEKLVRALEERVKLVGEQMKILAKAEVKYVEHNGMKLVLVPEGMGGKKIEDVMLVSVNSPLGSKLKDLQVDAVA